jgi:hypothetical protein
LAHGISLLAVRSSELRAILRQGRIPVNRENSREFFESADIGADSLRKYAENSMSYDLIPVADEPGIYLA